MPTDKYYQSHEILVGNSASSFGFTNSDDNFGVKASGLYLESDGDLEITGDTFSFNIPALTPDLAVEWNSSGFLFQNNNASSYFNIFVDDIELLSGADPAGYTRFTAVEEEALLKAGSNNGGADPEVQVVAENTSLSRLSSVTLNNLGITLSSTQNIRSNLEVVRSSNQTVTVVMGPEDFTSKDGGPGPVVTAGDYILSSLTPGVYTYLAPLPYRIPHGATLSSFSVLVTSQNSGSVVVTLKRREYSLGGIGSNVDTMLTLTSTNSASPEEKTDLGIILYPTIDRENYSYFIQIDIDNFAGGSSAIFYNAKIEYSTNMLGQMV
jgi:hypothetical protein